jgi:MOSC domain-containing protein YiiM
MVCELHGGTLVIGIIVSIVHTPADIDPKPPDRYARVALNEAHLAEGRGIVTDRKGGSLRRQLNVMARETLDHLQDEGYETAPGAMGEQLIIAGIDIDRLPPGARLLLGDEAIIEVDKPRTGCQRLQRIQGCTPAMVAGQLGVMARVLAGGTIRVGDEARLLAGEPAGAP